MTRAVLPAILSILAGCSLQGTVDSTLREAKSVFKTIRPEPDVSDVRAEVWLESTDLRAIGAQDVGGTLTYLETARILKAQTPALLKLGIVDAIGVAQMESMTQYNVACFHGLAFPSQGKVLLKPHAAEKVATAVHELSHIASHRMNYRDLNRTSLAPGRVLDPDWTSLDAQIAAWALEEGTAEVTERDGRPGFWTERKPVEMAFGEETRGPAALKRNGEVVFR